jgi:hypothetical protein
MEFGLGRVLNLDTGEGAEESIFSLRIPCTVEGVSADVLPCQPRRPGREQLTSNRPPDSFRRPVTTLLPQELLQLLDQLIATG